ncbi:MAG TPA: DUF3500 domain-containing protein, partial [Bryobacteraceae bacterium]|nr:DUF3500 domain-containing protein [Bryobacteraceae bacterium]
SRLHTAAVMTESAQAFLASLTPEQRAQATFATQDDERFDWHYIPKPRKGLPLRDMTPTQKQLAHALLAAGLSQRGYIKATTIMSLDEVLRVMENGKGPQRDPDGYFFTIFGEPSETGTWGYRIEGHHISQNFTVSNGKVQDAPSFFGSNPAEVLDGPRKGLRVLAREDDLGRELIASLTPEQKKIAVVTPKAPNDILTEASRKAALQGQPSGLEASKLNAHQRELLDNLLGEYVDNVPEQVAQLRQEQIKKAGNNLYFAWAGGEKYRDPHYYRIQTQAFLIEFDDTQDHANHIHSVWRDFNNDFGLDLLKEHYQTSHR